MVLTGQELHQGIHCDHVHKNECIKAGSCMQHERDEDMRSLVLDVEFGFHSI